MKKMIQVAGILLIALFVTACQDQAEEELDSPEEEQNTTEENESSVIDEDSSTETENEENEDQESSYEYEEQEIIEGQIEDGEYEVVVETDNKGKRILFYEIGGEKHYKTIFIKRDNRLKIIDIKNNNGQIYNQKV